MEQNEEESKRENTNFRIAHFQQQIGATSGTSSEQPKSVNKQMCDESGLNNEGKLLDLHQLCAHKDNINPSIQQLLEASTSSQQTAVKKMCTCLQEYIDTLVRFSKTMYEAIVNNDGGVWKVKERYATARQGLTFEALFNEMVQPQFKELNDDNKCGLQNTLNSFQIAMASAPATKASSFFDGPAQPKTAKRYVEIHTREKLVISPTGAWAAARNSETFLPLTGSDGLPSSFQQLLYAPFEQISGVQPKGQQSAGIHPSAASQRDHLYQQPGEKR